MSCTQQAIQRNTPTPTSPSITSTRSSVTTTSKTSLVLVDSVEPLAPAITSRAILIPNMPPLFICQLVGPLFATYGKLNMNIVLSRSQGLTGVLVFDSIECAELAYRSLHRAKVQLQPSAVGIGTQKLKSEEEKENDKRHQHQQKAVDFVLNLQFARMPLHIRAVPHATMSRVMKVETPTTTCANAL